MKNIAKRGLSLLLCLAMVFGFVVTATGPLTVVTANSNKESESENLLAALNPSFETTAAITGWSGTGIQSTEAVKDGTYSLKIKDSSATNSYRITSDYVTNFTVGKTYVASVQVKGSAVPTLSLIYYNSGNGRLATETVEGKANTDWQELTVELEAPQGAVKAAVVLGTTAASKGYAYFDMAALREKEDVVEKPVDPEITNGDFEGGFDATTKLPAGWKHEADNTTREKVTSGGNSVLQMTATASSKCGINTGNFKVTPGAVYVASVDAKKISGNAQVYLFLYLEKSESAITTSKSLSLPYVLNGNDWEKLTISAFVPDGYTHARLAIHVRGGDGVVQLDNVSVDLSTSTLMNASFEDKNTTSSVPQGWVKGPGGASNAQLLDATIGKTGSQSLLLNKNSSGNADVFSQYLTVTPGETYQASIWVKGDAVASLMQFMLCTYTKDSELSAVSAGVGTMVGTRTISPSATWTQYTITYTIPADVIAVRMRLVTRGSTIGKAYIDDATFEKVVNMASNHSFENWASPWLNNSQFVRVEGDGTDGEYCIKRADGVKSCSLYQKDIGVKPYGTYELKVDYKLTDGAARAFLKITMGTATTLIYVDEADGKWHTATATITAPDDATTGIIYFGCDSNITGNVYFDNVRFSMTDIPENAPTKPNLLTNGGFETRAHIPSWIISGSPNMNIMQTESNASDGKLSVAISQKGTWIWSQKIPVKAGESYRVALDAMGSAATQFGIRYYESADAKSEMSKTLGSAVLYEDGWETSYVDCVAPKGATYADILICTTGAAKGTSYYDNVKLYPYEVTYFDTLPNASFEQLNQRDFPVYWYPYNDSGIYTITSKVSDVWDGKYALRIDDPTDEANCGVKSDCIAVTPGKTYTFSLMTKEDEAGVYAHPAIAFYDENGKQISINQGDSSGSGAWALASIEAQAPNNAVYARAMVIAGRVNIGSFVVDALSFTTVEMPELQDVHPNWKIIESGHPRLYFSKKELPDRVAFSKDATDNVFGYSGKSVFADLKEDADSFVAAAKNKSVYKVTVDSVLDAPNCETFNPETGMATLNFGTWDSLPDINTAEERASIGLPVVKTGYPDYPSTGGYINEIRRRMEILSLAYAITGDTKYSDLAISYAMDLTEWCYWGDATEAKYQDALAGKRIQTDMANSYLTSAVSAVYDMCYDQLTKAERKALEEAILELGIKQLRYGMDTRVFHNYYAIYLSGVINGVCAIINEDNKEELTPYLDYAYNYARWYINCLENTGDQEGYLYTSHSVESMVESMAMLARVTGEKGLIGGTYFSDLLVPWVVNFVAPGGKSLPAYSDSQYTSYFHVTMSILNKETGNGLAGYYLSIVGGPGSSYARFMYTESDPVITEPTNFVTHVQQIGYGALRTGFEYNDMLLTMIANNSNFGHNQYDQNSFQLACSGSWLASDPGYTHTGTGKDYTNYSEFQGHNTILVDNATQILRGNGTMTSVLESGTYGYIIGSAPGAYGYDGKNEKLDKFDRHAIMVNHGAASYYVLMDDLSSFKDRTYTWNLTTPYQGAMEVDGKVLEKNQTIKGNTVSIEQGGQILRLAFAGKPLDIEAFMWKDAYGPMIRVDSPKQKDYQFLTVMNVTSAVGAGSQLIAFDSILKGSSTATFNNTPGYINWNTSSRISDDMVKIVQGSTVFFRGKEKGDWISFPFTVEADGTYELTLNMLKSTGYGKYQMYIDDVPYGDVYDGLYKQTIAAEHDMGVVKLTAGEHRFKMVVDRSTDEEDYIGVTSLMLKPYTGQNETGLPANTLEITESFESQSVRGARISYAADRSDLILFNLGAKSISASGVQTDAAQISLLGIDTNGNIVDGFAVKDATTLTYQGKTLLKAEKPVDLVVDFASGEVKIEAHSDVKQNVTFYIGNANYNVNLNGVTLKDHMLSMTLNKGKTTFDVTCSHVYDQEVADPSYTFAIATCTEKATYYKSCVCGAVGEETFEYGEPNGHDWRDAICYAPKTCFVCRVTEGEALGHDWVDATCTTPQTCSRCPMVGQLALGHEIVEVLDGDGNILYWTCTTCGACFSDPDGMNEITNMDSSTSPDSAGNGMLIIIIVVAALVVIAGAVAVILIVKKKKRGNTETPADGDAEETQEE